MERDWARPVKVEARPGYRIWLEYSDGVSGEVDLSHWVGRGVFTIWNEPGSFEGVYLDSWGAVAWRKDIELCPDSLYLEITGKTFEELMEEAKTQAIDD